MGFASPPHSDNVAVQHEPNYREGCWSRKPFLLQCSKLEASV
jgi:hypothetical protein